MTLTEWDTDTIFVFFDKKNMVEMFGIDLASVLVDMNYMDKTAREMHLANP